jgi:hypothetical protein
MFGRGGFPAFLGGAEIPVLQAVVTVVPVSTVEES